MIQRLIVQFVEWVISQLQNDRYDNVVRKFWRSLVFMNMVGESSRESDRAKTESIIAVGTKSRTEVKCGETNLHLLM